MANRKNNKRNYRVDKRTEIISEGPPKVVAKRYHVTSQTAYHITELALRENTSEGRIIDKLMRSYLATQRFRP